MGFSSHTLFIKNDGSVYSCGYNYYGQLGLDDKSNKCSITKVNTEGVKNVIAATNYSFITKTDGTVWSCGYNTFGSLALGDKDDRQIFSLVDIDNVKHIFTGDLHTIFLKNDGTVYSCGNNGAGQLGLGDTVQKSLPTKIDIDDVSFVACGGQFTMFLKNDGTVLGTGQNLYGQIGNGDKNDKNLPTKTIIDNVRFVAAGYQHTVFIKNDNTVYTCGYNNSGQLGNGNKINSTLATKINIDDVKYVSCGYRHTVFLKNDGTVYTCGNNDYGQLGTGNKTELSVPTKINIDNVKSVFAGQYYTIFLKNDGTVYGCGQNNYGQLGLENYDNPILEITKINIDNVSRILNQMDLITILHILKDNNVYKTITNNVLEDLGSELPSMDIIKEKGIENLNDLLFETDGVKLIDSLSDTFDIISYTDGDPLTKLNCNVLPKPQIIKAKGDIGLSSFENIDKIEVITTGTSGIVRIAVSFDKGKSWKTYNDGTWIDMSLDNQTFKEKGISLEQLNIIPNSLWNVGLIDKLIRFAYYIEYENESDNISVDALKITADMLGKWKKAIHGIDYDYEYSSNTSLLVNLLTDGTYKINYGEFNVDLPNNDSIGKSVLALPLTKSAFVFSNGYYKYRWVHNKNTKYMMISGVEASTGNSMLITHQVVDDNTIDIISSEACDTLITVVF